MNEYPSNTPPPPPGAAPPPPPWSNPGAQPGPGPGGVSENRQVFLVLSYLWVLALIPYLMEKNDREVQWHAKHGLVLTGAEIVLAMVLGIVSFVPVLGCVAAVLALVVMFAQLALHVYCIVKALNGERVLIPGISQFADQF